MVERAMKTPSIERLSELFTIDPETGLLSHKTPARKHAVGEEAGYLNSIGYRQVAFDGKIYSVHRIAWALYYGEQPKGEIDHINGDRSDNRKGNLRLATSAQNNQNRRLSARNKTGIKGVFRVKRGKPWRVAVGFGRGSYYITQFDCFGQAVKHANEIRSRLHRQFARAA